MRRTGSKNRLFIAIPLSPEVGRRILEYQTKHGRQPIKWIPQESLHVTLFFLGEISEKKNHKIIYKLESMLEKREPFTMNLGKISLYPAKKARMVWGMFNNNYEEFRALVGDLSELLDEFVRAQERSKVIPHITIGRLKSRVRSKKVLEEVLERPLAVRVETVVLFRSHLTSEGSVYEPLYSFPLMGI